MSVSLDQFVVKQALISASSSGSNTVIAAVPTKQIWVLKIALISNGSVNVKFQSGANGQNLTGLFYLIANTGFVMNENGGQYAVPWFVTRTNDLLAINLSDNIAVGGVLTYIEVEAGEYSSSSSSCRSSSSSSRSVSSSSSSSSCRSSSSSSLSSSSSSSSANP